jgi:type IV pilus assembly protein PilW
VRVWNSTSGTGFDMRLVPFEINPAGIPAGDASTDTILITYGTADSFVAGVQADQPGLTPTENFILYSNREGFRNGDLFVSVQPGGGPGGSASCVMHEATKAPPASGNCATPPPAPTQLVHATGTYKNFGNGCQNATATHNSGGGIRDAAGNLVPAVRLGSGGQLFNLGIPAMHVYAIRNGNLTMCDWIAADCTVAASYNTVVNDVVSLRAVYGMNLTPAVNALAGDGLVNNNWTRTALTANAFLPSRVVAVALQITARSSLKEKQNQANACDATPSKTRPDRTQDWMYQSMAGAEIDLSASGLADWDCYRYKLFQTRVPLRNMIWRP